jgi:hypothetical protein
MEKIRISAGTTVIVGESAKPIATTRSGSLRELVTSLDGVMEANLPECFLLGTLPKPAQVLTILVPKSGSGRATVNAIDEGLFRILPQGIPLGV